MILIYWENSSTEILFGQLIANILLSVIGPFN